MIEKITNYIFMVFTGRDRELEDKNKRLKDEKETLEYRNEKLRIDVRFLSNKIQQYKSELNPKQLAMRNIQMVLEDKIVFSPQQKSGLYIDLMLKIIKELNEIDGGT